GLSLWLIPPEPLQSVLESMIKAVSKMEGSPSFKPHMTIATFPVPSDIPPIEPILAPLRNEWAGLKPRFQSLHIGSSYFVSVALALQPTDQLKEFQERIRQELSFKLNLQAPDKPFFPHISLFYGDVSMEKRKNVETAIRGLAGPRLVEYGDSIMIDDYDHFIPDEIWVVKTEGRAEEWEVLEKFPF
ncbi:LigT-like protein, partial [Serendipita vermifera]